MKKAHEHGKESIKRMYDASLVTKGVDASYGLRRKKKGGTAKRARKNECSCDRKRKRERVHNQSITKEKSSKKEQGRTSRIANDLGKQLQSTTSRSKKNKERKITIVESKKKKEKEERRLSVSPACR